jgi:hypothetical protein
LIRARRQESAFRSRWDLAAGAGGDTGEHHLFAFLSNDIVRPIHAKAMAVLLTAAEEWDTLLAGSADKPSLYKRHCRTKCSDRVRSEDLNRFKNRAKRSGYGAFEKCRNVRSSLAIRCTAD